MNNEPEKDGRMNKFTSYLTGKGFYKVIAGCIAVIAIAGWFVGSRLLDYNNLVKDGDEELTSTATNSDTVQVASGSGEGEYGKSNEVVDVTSGDTAQAGKDTSTATGTKSEGDGDKATANTGEKELFVMPLSGKVQNAYSGDTLVLNETYSDWRVHSGVDIAGTLGAQVKAAGSGKVLSVDSDPVWGTIIKIKHDNGVITIYSNLGSSPIVKKDQKVDVGEVIGSVGQTAQAEIAQEPHLHFAAMKNDQYIDPLSIIADMSKNP